jgi:D-aminopeptidase
MENRIELMPLESRCRIRELGITPGTLPTGPLNAITDVKGVRVGHFTLIEGEEVRTGATAILPHSGNLFQEKAPAGFVVGNGYGKFAGSTQILELGEIETPILLTSTLAMPRAADALIEWTLAQPGNENVRSVNPVVGETNDGVLNNSRKRALTVAHMLQAIASAQGGPVTEGCVGAGTGTICFGWKGGIGTSSRRLPDSQGGYMVGALAQTNYGGILQIDGLPVGKVLGRDGVSPSNAKKGGGTPPLRKDDGSIIIILATDAPLSDRNLTRLARRGLFGLARTGASFSDGSGDYALAFSSAESVRRTPERRNQVYAYPEVSNDKISPLFLAAIEATEEAIYNSLTMATAMTGYRGVTVEALPLTKVVELVQSRKLIK